MIGSLASIFDGYLDVRWRIQPVAASQAGLRAYDGVYADRSAAAVREHIAALRSYTAALEEAPADALDDEIDRTAALHDARHLLLVLERERPFTFNPALHLAEALDGLYVLLIRSGEEPAQRAAALLARLRALPGFLRRAVDVVTEPCRPLVALASAMLPGGLAIVREGLAEASLDWSALDPRDVAQARAAAVDALLEFGDALAQMSEQARENFAIGRDLFDRKLHTAHMIREGADELLRYGERLRAECTAELARIANEIEPGADWRDVIARLREDLPERDTAVGEYADALHAAREFTVANDLMRVPEDRIEVVPTPSFLRPLVPFVAYQGPGAFENGHGRGLFFVTLPDPGERWRAGCRAELPSTALHEGVPGHHQQVVTANGLPRIMRRVISTPAACEGWAVYCESLMAETGYLASPAERLFQAHHLLWRAVRVILDVSLHTKGMSVEAAAQRLRDDVGLDAASAAAEAIRYCAYPTYQLCYAVGRRDILRLRDDARRARGSAFSLAAFHDELLGYGALPTALARWGMGLA